MTDNPDTSVEHTRMNGWPARCEYLTDKLEPCPKEKACYVRVTYDGDYEGIVAWIDDDPLLNDPALERRIRRAYLRRIRKMGDLKPKVDAICDAPNGQRPNLFRRVDGHGTR
jgi:hypothetical protein